jgi:hypothetical protein
VKAAVPVLQPFYDGWENYQRLLIEALRPLMPRQMALRPAPGQWAVWLIASHMAGARMYWFHDVLGEGDSALRDRFRVAQTTVPGLPVEMAGWEDDENHPRASDEVVAALVGGGSELPGALVRSRPRRPLHSRPLPLPANRAPRLGRLAPHRARPASRRRDLVDPGQQRPGRAQSLTGGRGRSLALARRPLP